jgi:hypothetical protein
MRIYAYIPNDAAIIQQVYCYVGTAPAVAALRVNVKKNGLDFITGGYIEIPIGNSVAYSNSFTSDILNNNDYLNLDIVQGDTVAEDLTVHVRYRMQL